MVPLVAHFAHSFQDEAGGRLSLSAGMQVVEEEEEEVEEEKGEVVKGGGRRVVKGQGWRLCGF